MVRITPDVDEADEYLGSAGFVREGATDVMVSSLGPSLGLDERIAVAAAPSTQWLDVASGLQGVPPDLRASWEGIIGRIRSRPAFALASVGGSVSGAGMAVLDGVWMGLFEINVAPGARRRGLGGAISRGLLGWGYDRGARRVYLQVVHDNEPAVALYRSLGFETVYGYWYRRAPAG